MNTSVSEWWIVGDSEHWSMRRYNDHAHLEGALSVTGDAPAPI
jgi:hypothetical protein